MPKTDEQLSEQSLKWVINSIDPQAYVESFQRLQGGMSSIVHRISVRVGQESRNYVLRLFDNKEWLHHEPDLAHHEAESLRMANSIVVPTPQIIAFDETGSECGLPAVLMTHLEGTVILKPRDMNQWIDGLAATLAQIHKVDAKDFPWTYFTYNDIFALQIPSWSNHPHLWGKAIDILKNNRPNSRECFIHRDYHPTNVLWNQDKVSGVVDWVNACRGPAGIDVGHCRLNLAQLYDVHIADQFLQTYQSHAGTVFHYDPYWDLLALIEVLDGPPTVYLGWTALGVTDLTDQLIRERLDRYLVSILDRITY